MTFSSFSANPGVVIWHSRDLVNWAPIGAALTRPLGSVWAMDLIKHNGRYYIYIPANPNGVGSIFVIYTDDIRGPWSDPIDLQIAGCIDPGHAVGEDGKRYCPHNPIVHTRSAAEPWWSRGHATLVEGPAGDGWMIYHGYENGFRTSIPGRWKYPDFTTTCWADSPA